MRLTLARPDHPLALGDHVPLRIGELAYAVRIVELAEGAVTVELPDAELMPDAGVSATHPRVRTRI